MLIGREKRSTYRLGSLYTILLTMARWVCLAIPLRVVWA